MKLLDKLFKRLYFAKDYNVLIVAIILLTIGFSIKIHFMTFKEYVAYLDHPRYIRVLFNLMDASRFVIKVLSMLIGGTLVGEYASRKVKLKG